MRIHQSDIIFRHKIHPSPPLYHINCGKFISPPIINPNFIIFNNWIQGANFETSIFLSKFEVKVLGIKKLVSSILRGQINYSITGSIIFYYCLIIS